MATVETLEPTTDPAVSPSTARRPDLPADRSKGGTAADLAETDRATAQVDSATPLANTAGRAWATPPLKPTLSICIPTFKRARYLDSLMGMLSSQMQNFRHSFEIVLADNGSPDATPEVVAKWASVLPIRHWRHPENLGGAANWHFVIDKARGEFVLTLPDDDAIIPEALAQTIDRLLADPEVGMVCTPWILYDLVAGQQTGQFYRHPEDYTLGVGEFERLLDLILTHRIWPEIYLVRRSLFHAVMPRVHPFAFYAFMHAGEVLARSKVILQREPFFVSITRYFADETRSQTGLTEVEHAWDRYRGGLELLLSRFTPGLSAEALTRYRRRIDDFTAERMSVAIRLRLANQRDFVDAYYLSRRLIAAGQAAMLPAPLESIRSFAALEFLVRDGQLQQGVDGLVVLGSAEPVIRDWINARATFPVHYLDQAAVSEVPSGKLVFVRANRQALSVDEIESITQRGCRIVSELDLMRKFF